MKEIRYRAKNIETEEWETGYYVRLQSNKVSTKTHRIYTGYAEEDTGELFPEYVDVNSKTVCQFTGMRDMNENEIYEHDIVEARIGKAYIIGEVKNEDGVWVIVDYGKINLFDVGSEYIKILDNTIDNTELLDKTHNEKPMVSDFIYSGRVRIMCPPKREVSEKSFYRELIGKEGKIVTISQDLIGVKIDEAPNPESKYDCFWFDAECLEKI